MKVLRTDDTVTGSKRHHHHCHLCNLPTQLSGFYTGPCDTVVCTVHVSCIMKGEMFTKFRCRNQTDRNRLEVSGRGRKIILN